MDIAILKRLKLGTLFIALFGLLIIASLYLLSQAPQHSNQLKPGYIALFAITLLELFVLAVLIGKGLFRLLRLRRNQAVGSKLTFRLFFVFVSLSLIPAFIVYIFSLQFIFKSIDSRLNDGIGKALNSALQLSQTVLDKQSNKAMQTTESIAATLANAAIGANSFTRETVHALQKKHFAFELALIAADGTVIALSNEKQSQYPHVSMESKPYPSQVTPINIQAIDDSGRLYIHTVAPVINTAVNAPPYYLSTLFSVDPRFSQLANDIQLAFVNHQKNTFLQPVLKTSFTTTLSLVLLLCLLTAIWAAFHAAKRIVSPLRILAIGTRAIAAGHYEKQLPQTSHDEIGLLVSSFNQMSHNISVARDEAEQHRQSLEQQRAYLESILSHISSGVIVLDKNLHLTLFNKASDTILETRLKSYLGQTINDISTKNTHEGWHALFEALFQQVINESSPKEWQQELLLVASKSNKILACKGTPLMIQERNQGHIILLNDITSLIQAQKNAAWSEVAERLAHEIKNPLTPIQLSAERLSRKFDNSSKEEFAVILKRATHTITQQVENLKDMLNAFNEYARPPKLSLKSIGLNTLIAEVVDLYDGMSSQASFILDLANDMPFARLDPGRLRQLLHNLLKNSLEACPEKKQSNLAITLTTAHTHENNTDRGSLTLTVQDNGTGFPENMLEKAFNPYVTNKTKGSGLGLAIVKKIIEEHKGTIQASNHSQGGACIIMQIPVS